MLLSRLIPRRPRQHSAPLCGRAGGSEHHSPPAQQRGGAGRGERARLDAAPQGLRFWAECGCQEARRVSLTNLFVSWSVTVVSCRGAVHADGAARPRQETLFANKPVLAVNYVVWSP